MSGKNNIKKADDTKQYNASVENIKEMPELPKKLTNFKTERGGSVYVVFPDGSTQRFKGPSGGIHEGDVGMKQKSSKTVYVTKEDKDKIAGAYSTGPPKEKRDKLSLNDDGAISYVFWRGVKNGIPFGNRYAITIKSQSEPKVGLKPVEFWDNTFHIGSTITEINKPKNALTGC